MSLNEMLNIQRLNELLTNFEKLGEDRPTGREADAIAVIGDSIEYFRKELRAIGFAADGADDCRSLETVMLWYFYRSNPGYEHLEKKDINPR